MQIKKYQLEGILEQCQNRGLVTIQEILDELKEFADMDIVVTTRVKSKETYNKMLEDDDSVDKITKSESTVGTSLQGYLDTTYSNLIKIFGEPHYGRSGDGKVQCEWHFEFEDGEVFTIYDYKERKAPENVTEWHIGGTKPNIVPRVQYYFCTILNKMKEEN